MYVYTKRERREACWECGKVHGVEQCPKHEPWWVGVDWKAVEARADEVWEDFQRNERQRQLGLNRVG